MTTTDRTNGNGSNGTGSNGTRPTVLREITNIGHVRLGSASVASSASSSTVVASIRREVIARLTEFDRLGERQGGVPMTSADHEALGRELIVDALGAYARDALANGAPVLSRTDEADIEQRCVDALFGLGRLQRLLDDPSIENIDANGCDRVFVRYADGTRERVDPIADNDVDFLELLQRVFSRHGHSERRLDRAAPFASIQLPSGARFVGTYSVSDRPCLSIRRHRYLRVTPEDLLDLHTIDRTLRSFFGGAMRAKKSLVISGGAGVGKTTLLRAVAADIPPHERLVKIEDSYELGLGLYEDLHPDVVALEAREANIEGEGEVTLADLVRHALRLSPDRVIVGEARGAEVLALLNAMSQGNDGSMATIHASSSKGAFGKIATYAVQAPERLDLAATNLLIANAVHFVVHLERDGTTTASSRRCVR